MDTMPQWLNRLLPPNVGRICGQLTKHLTDELKEHAKRADANLGTDTSILATKTVGGFLDKEAKGYLVQLCTPTANDDLPNFNWFFWVGPGTAKDGQRAIELNSRSEDGKNIDILLIQPATLESLRDNPAECKATAKSILRDMIPAWSTREHVHELQKYVVALGYPTKFSGKFLTIATDDHPKHTVKAGGPMKVSYDLESCTFVIDAPRDGVLVKEGDIEVEEHLKAGPPTDVMRLYAPLAQDIQGITLEQLRDKMTAFKQRGLHLEQGLGELGSSLDLV